MYRTNPKSFSQPKIQTKIATKKPIIKQTQPKAAPRIEKEPEPLIDKFANISNQNLNKIIDYLDLGTKSSSIIHVNKRFRSTQPNLLKQLSFLSNVTIENKVPYYSNNFTFSDIKSTIDELKAKYANELKSLNFLYVDFVYLIMEIYRREFLINSIRILSEDDLAFFQLLDMNKYIFVLDSRKDKNFYNTKNFQRFFKIIKNVRECDMNLVLDFMTSKKEVYFYDFYFTPFINNHREIVLKYFTYYPNHLKSISKYEKINFPESTQDSTANLIYEFAKSFVSLNLESLEKIPFGFVQEKSFNAYKKFSFEWEESTNSLPNYLKYAIDRIILLEDINIDRTKVNEFTKIFYHAKNLEVLNCHMNSRDIKKLGDINLKNLKELNVSYWDADGSYVEDFLNSDSVNIMTRIPNLRKFCFRVVDSNGYSRFPDIFSIKNVYESRFSIKSGLPYKMLVPLLKKNKIRRYHITMIDEARPLYQKFLKELEVNKEYELLKRFRRSYIHSLETKK